MQNTTIEYTIDYESHIRKTFPYPERKHMVDTILGGTPIKKLIITLTGHDEEENGKMVTVEDTKTIQIPESGEYIYIDDERIHTGLRRLIAICQEHYIKRDDKKPTDNSITWKIIEK